MAVALGRSLRPLVTRAMERLGIPGVAVGILHNGEERTFAFGVTNIEFPLEVDEHTLFQIGSTTKTFTGTAIMRLVEEGKVDLDAPVVKYLPGFKLTDASVTSQVRVHHLLTHTGGWLGDYFDDPSRGRDALRRIVANMAKHTPQLTPVGKVWSYNNAGFYVAGRLIEVATKKPYEDVIAEWIFKPLGMEKSFFFPEHVITHKTALGHLRLSDGTVKVARPWGLARSANAAGGIVSTVVDQLRYARFHLGNGTAPDGTRLLTARTLKRMQRRTAPAGGPADAVGLTWLLQDVGRLRLVKHGGSINGHMSEFVLVPSEGFAVTVLTNGSRGHELGHAVVDWALEKVLGVRKPAPTFQHLPGPALAPYEGRYAIGDYGDLVVGAQNGGLLATVDVYEKALEDEPDLAAMLPPPTPLAFVGRDRAITTGEAAGSRVDFLRGTNRDVEWIRWGGRIYRKAAAS